MNWDNHSPKRHFYKKKPKKQCDFRQFTAILSEIPETCQGRTGADQGAEPITGEDSPGPRDEGKF